MEKLERKYFKNRESFRSWLELNHKKSAGIWMVFYKNHLKKDHIKYREALEEVLCFGWIDSIVKKVDEDQYLRKFTPRTNVSNWSDLNKKIVLSLIQNGKMTEAGLSKIDVYLKTGKVNWDVTSSSKERIQKETHIPDFILKEFSNNEPALTHFNNLAKSYKRNYIQWITNAKREATIQKRLKESIDLLKENRKIGMK